jgi:hypothetical protein
MELIDTYLDRVRSHLHLDARTEVRIIRELKSHFEDELAELQSGGMPLQDSAEAAIRSSGNPQSLANLFYQAYSRGSWIETLLALQPHLVTAALFLTHLWSNPLALLVAFTGVLLVALGGWHQGRPNWAYPWIGYSFSPFIAMIFFSRDFIYSTAKDLILGSRLSLMHMQMLAFVGLYALFIAVVVFSVVRVVKRDWLLVSFMLFPLPVLGVWISEIARIGARFYSTDPVAYGWDGIMAAAFLLLGLCSAAFVRIRRRLVRILLLASMCLGATLLVGIRLLESSPFLTLQLLVSLPVFTLLAPAVLERILGHGELPRPTAGKPDRRTPSEQDNA